MILANAIDIVSNDPESNGMVIRGAVMESIQNSQGLSELDKADMKLVASIVFRNLDIKAPTMSGEERTQLKKFTNIIRNVVSEYLAKVEPARLALYMI